jgi:1-phosphatidylinositol phosphodiesterase
MSGWIQLFYRGTDNNLYTNWRSPDPNGSWSGETKLGGLLNGKPFCAVVPGTNVMQVFYRGGDKGLWTRWRNADGSWSSEEGMGGILNGDPIAAALPGTNVLQVFYRGADNHLYTRIRTPDGNWSAEAAMGGGVLNGDPIAAALPGTNILHLFYRGGDNGLWTRWRDTTWSSEVEMGGLLNGNPSAAVVPGANVLQVFYRGLDNILHSNWRTPGPKGHWTGDANMGGVVNGDPIAAVFPGANILQVFYRGAGNGLYTNWRTPDPNGHWTGEQGKGGVLNGDPIAAAIPGSNILQLFYRGSDNRLISRWRNADGSWSSEQGMGGVLNADPIVAASPPAWMSRMADSALLSQLTLPGTHDSCTAGLTPIASCQAWSLQDQLNHGIRYIDIRCRQIQSTFAIHHYEVFTGLMFGDGVRDVCVDFLEANPTECIVMQIKWHEWNDDNPVGTFQQVLDGYLQGFKGFFYLDNRIPTLGEVRGKIVVVRRFDLDAGSGPRGLEPLTWQDNTTFDVTNPTSENESATYHIQNQYNVPTILGNDLTAKWNAIQALLDQAKADASDAWYINFASGSSSGAYPYSVSTHINPSLFNYLGGAQFANRLGTLMQDFPDDLVIARITSLLNMPAFATS